MGSIEIFILILAVVVCLLLALIILVQNPKGGGLATGFTGTGNVGGVQKTTDFLEKSTWYLAVILFALCLVSARFSTTTVIAGQDQDDSDTEQIDEEPEINDDDGTAVPTDANLEELLNQTTGDGDADGDDGAGADGDETP